LFDEIEKASDSLWNLLLGILDKATLTLGDNRRVDFSRAMIFMTSNLGASEMNSIMKPKLGFSAGELERQRAAGQLDDGLQGKISRAGVEAARRKFTPEFMNRIDRVVVFQPLGANELKKILSIELNMLQQRIFNSAQTTPFVFNITEPAQDFLLREGTDVKYGARHLKRTIERSLVHPLSNLIASGQIQNGDLIQVDFDAGMGILTFTKEAENIPGYMMVQMTDTTAPVQAAAAAIAAESELPRVASAKSTRRS
jgi:ATP-dependent Clp protease ATP-binding subunit ClpA